MDLKDFLKIIKKNLIFLFILTVIGFSIGFFSADFFASGYQHTQYYFLTEKPTNIFDDSERSSNLTDTAVAILDSPDFQNEFFKNGSLSVRRVAPQVIQITYISQTKDEAIQTLQDVTTHFNSKIADLSQSTYNAQLKKIGKPNEPIYSSLSRNVIGIFGATLGLAFALFIVSLKNYFKL